MFCHSIFLRFQFQSLFSSSHSLRFAFFSVECLVDILCVFFSLTICYCLNLSTVISQSCVNASEHNNKCVFCIFVVECIACSCTERERERTDTNANRMVDIFLKLSNPNETTAKTMGKKCARSPQDWVPLPFAPHKRRRQQLKNKASSLVVGVVWFGFGVHCFFCVYLSERISPLFHHHRNLVLLHFFFVLFDDNSALCMNLLNFNFHLNGLIVVVNE